MADIDRYEETRRQSFQNYLLSGGVAGDWTKNWYKWVEDPVSYYYTRPYPPIELVSENSEAKPYKNALPSVIDELTRIDTQKEEKVEDRPGYFKMGTVELTIPPIQINVNDVKQNKLEKTLRTDTDVVLQSGHATKIMELDIYFHNIDDINNKLRPLLAQLKASPYIPLYSKYLYNMLNPSGDEVESIDENGVDKNSAKEISYVDYQIEAYRTGLRKAIRNNEKLEIGKPNLIEDLNSYWNGSLDDLNTSKLDREKGLMDNIDKMLVEAGSAENVEDKSTVKYETRNTEVNTRRLRDEKVSKFKNLKAPDEGKGNLVGVLSTINIATVAGFPESLACHATFFLFNYHPYSKKFEFLDKNNNPTLDVDKCNYFIQWYTTRFLQQNSGSGKRFYKPLDGSMDGELIFRYNYPTRTTDEDGNIAEDTKPLFVKTDHNSVCAAISISQRNSISFLPILGWSVPSCQYLGAHNAEVNLTIDTIDDEFIENLKYILDVVEKQSRTGDKSRRTNYLTVENEILELVGIDKCVVNSISATTVEDSPGMSRIQINMVEFDINQLDEEKIRKYRGDSVERIDAWIEADIQSYKDTRDTSYKDLTDILGDDKVYLHAAGGRENILDIGEPDKWVSFAPDSDRMKYLKDMINDSGFKVVSTRVEKLDIRRGTVIEIREKALGGTGVSADTMPYVGRHKKIVAANIKEKITGSEQAKIVLANKKYYRDALWETNDLSGYRKYVIDNLRTYFSGNGPDIPSNVYSSFENLGLLKTQDKAYIVYQDMDLPTYNDTKRVGRGAIKPSYATLGIPAPDGINPNFSPREDSDIVEPDFYFYYEALKKAAGSIGDSGLRFSFKELLASANTIYGEEAVACIDGVVNSLQNPRPTGADKPIRSITVDGILTDEGLKIYKNSLNNYVDKARKLRDSIQGTSSSTTTPDDYNRYQTIGADLEGSTEEDREWYKKQASKKEYNQSEFIIRDDSGVDVYGGLAPDASVLEVTTEIDGIKKRPDTKSISEQAEAESHDEVIRGGTGYDAEREQLIQRALEKNKSKEALKNVEDRLAAGQDGGIDFMIKLPATSPVG